KHILKRLLRTPLFTTLTVLTLAIGIGANTAIFSVVEGILLRPLPFSQADELVAVDHSAPGVNLANAGAAPFLYFTYREDSKTFEDVGLWNTGTASLTGRAEPEEIRSLNVTPNVLPILKVQPLVGRTFSETDGKSEQPLTVILTYGYWRTKFGGDQSIVGRTITLDGRSREVIGVLPETFLFLDARPAVVRPIQFDRSKILLGQFNFAAVARLKPGTSIAQASAEVARMIPIAIGRFPAPPGFSVKMFEEARLGPLVRPLKQSLVGDLTAVLWVLMGTVGIVLLIACANVANLLLVRAEGRQQELSIRAALGAGWGRIARELLVESLTLGVAGSVVALALAYGALTVLKSMAPANLPRVDEISIGAPVLLFTAIVALVASTLFGMVPVFKYAGPQLGTALRAGGRSLSDSRERHRARSVLVVIQVALALVLLVSSGLMIRTFQALRHVDPGFVRPQEVQTFRISIPESAVKEPEAVARMQQNIRDRLAEISGVTSVAFTTVMPLEGGNWNDPVFAEDRVYKEGQIPPLRSFKFVSPGLISAMGNRLIAGRDLTWSDTYEKHKVALVSENLARELWQTPQNAIGKRIRDSLKAPWREVVGVVSDERVDGIDRKPPTMVIWPVLMDQFSDDEVSIRRSVAYVVRSSRTGSTGFVDEIRRTVWSVNPNLPLAGVRTLQDIYNRSLARTSFTLVMLALAGGMALLLGIAGIYGVMSYSVSQRTREIGIRVALGAQSDQVVRMFVSHGARLAAVGIVCGVLAAAGLTRFLSTLLFDVKPTDPLTYVLVCAGLVSAAVIASYVPALRATSVDPVEALRAE
ncbi:MAG TPA: ABC transporter permease, partial [Vicinamibacterales bacterium]|nr:ABC transporter permease [Vicinamibacterales bacterium]